MSLEEPPKESKEPCIVNKKKRADTKLASCAKKVYKNPVPKSLSSATSNVLRVTRKLLHVWTKGPRSPYKLSCSKITQISLRFVNFQRFIPKEFARKPKGINELDRWKATELRQFLLYTGQFCLKRNTSRSLLLAFYEISCCNCNIGE